MDYLIKWKECGCYKSLQKLTLSICSFMTFECSEIEKNSFGIQFHFICTHTIELQEVSRCCIPLILEACICTHTIELQEVSCCCIPSILEACSILSNFLFRSKLRWFQSQIQMKKYWHREKETQRDSKRRQYDPEGNPEKNDEGY